MKSPALSRSIIPGLPFPNCSSLINVPVAVLTSTRWFTATSVTNAVPVRSEKVAQHVAFWSAIFVRATTLATLLESSERVAEPKDASVTKISLFCNSAVPKSTAVPAGEERVSAVETAPSTIGNTDRKPVLLTAGFPFTVVIRAEKSLLKKVCETVFSGPLGGVV